MKARDWVVLAACLALVLLLRFSSFFKSVIDWDESLLMLMARSLLRGEIPYTTVWDHSPLGTVLLFAVGQVLFGPSVLAIRLITWIMVAVESFLLYRLGELLGRPGAGTGLIAGTLYAIWSLNNNGLAAHRELLFAPFVTLAVYLLISGFRHSATRSVEGTQPAWEAGLTVRLVLAGLLLGFGLQVKFLYIFDVFAVFLIVGALLLERTGSIRVTFRPACTSYALLALGPVAILGLVTLYFVLNGHLGDYFLANLAAAAVYSTSGEPSLALLGRTLLGQISRNALLWLSLFLASLYVVFAKETDKNERWSFLYLFVWFAFALIGSLFTGRLWSHYFLQLLPPLCLITALFITGIIRPQGNVQSALGRVLVLLLIVLAPSVPLAYPALVENLGLIYRHYSRGIAFPVDTPAVVSAYLREHVTGAETIYVVDYEPIVYYLAGIGAPTKYVFPPHLIDEQFSKTDRIDPLAELDAIMSQRPAYVIRISPPSPDMTNQAFAVAVDEYMKKQYVLEKVFLSADTFTGRPISVELYHLANPL